MRVSILHSPPAKKEGRGNERRKEDKGIIERKGRKNKIRKRNEHEDKTSEGEGRREQKR